MPTTPEMSLFLSGPDVTIYTTSAVASPTCKSSRLSLQCWSVWTPRRESAAPAPRGTWKIHRFVWGPSALAPNIGTSVCLTHPSTRNYGACYLPRSWQEAEHRTPQYLHPQICLGLLLILWDSVQHRRGVGYHVWFLEASTRLNSPGVFQFSSLLAGGSFIPLRGGERVHQIRYIFVHIYPIFIIETRLI